MERCFYVNNEHKEIIDCKIPSWDHLGRPSWPDGGGPPMGTQYSVTGDRYSEYYMLDAYPDDRNQHRGMRLPKRIVLRKWDLFGRQGRSPAY
jgi:hypothetical protein